MKTGEDWIVANRGSRVRNNGTAKQVDVAYWFIQKELGEALVENDPLAVGALLLVRDRIIEHDKKIDHPPGTPSVVDRFNDAEGKLFRKRHRTLPGSPNLMSQRNAFNRRRSAQ